MIEEVINEANIENALTYLEGKKNNSGIDGMKISELRNYLSNNKDVFIKSVLNGTYTFGLIRENEILNYSGKRRVIAQIISLDRLLLRCLFQVIELKTMGKLSDSSFAFQKNKGVSSAISYCKKLIIDNRVKYVLNLDIKDFFDSVDHDIMISLLKKYGICDRTCELIYKHLKSKTVLNMEIKQKDVGLVQGSLLSPLLSNIYLNELDKYIEENNILFCRYADDLRIFVDSYAKAVDINKLITEFIKQKLKLDINKKKTGIVSINEMNYLGYSFICDKNTGLVEVKRKQNSREYNKFSAWHESSIEKNNDIYYVINNGILTQKDFTLLFENEQKKMIIPSNVTSTLNVYSSITFSSSFFKYISEKKIVINLFDNYGEKVGTFIPNNMNKEISLELEQLKCYMDDRKRLSYAKQFAMAAAHNLRENLKYYNKCKKSEIIEDKIKKIGELIKKENECDNVQSLMAYEGQIRINYYSCINEILPEKKFVFENRNKMPPRDPINSLISFGNTLLYNYVAKEIYKSRLCIKIGYLHTTNKRNETLNLDISELFRPIIVDRTIFSMINKGMINEIEYFDYYDDKVFLNEKGKKLFIKSLSNKLDTKRKDKNEYYSYSDLISKEIKNLIKSFECNEQYKAYKYFN